MAAILLGATPVTVLSIQYTLFELYAQPTMQNDIHITILLKLTNGTKVSHKIS